VNDHRPWSPTLVVAFGAVKVTDVGRHATQLLRIGAPVFASRRVPDVVVTAAARTLVARWLGSGCAAGLDVAVAPGVGLVARRVSSRQAIGIQIPYHPA
jgi:hypothetical protein